MSSTLPPGVVKGTFTFSPNAGVDIENTDAINDAVKNALHLFKAPKTVAVVETEYIPTSTDDTKS